MAKTLTAIGTAVVANAAAVGTAASITTAEATALGNLLLILGARNDLSQPPLVLLNSAQVTPN